MAWYVSVQWWGDDRQVSQSGKPLCTGASLWAVPKLAMGVCPLEPRHANGDNSVLEISTGYFFSDCHGLAKTLSCIHCHLVTNSVSYEDGRKLHNTKKDLERMKQLTNQMCRERGLTVVEKGKHFDGTTT